MRRSLLGLLTVAAIGGLLLTAGCEVFQQDPTLRVVSINGGKSLRADIADFYSYFDPIDSEYILIYQYMPDTVEVVLQYIEIGAGLPTWTPYVATLTEAKIKYSGTSEDAPAYTSATVPLRQTVKADATGKMTTTFNMTAMSATFKQTWFEGEVQEPPPNGEYNIFDLIKATVTFSGYDSVADRAVKTAGDFQIEVGNFYDDLNRFGQ
jgi:hypothetical protein